MNATGRTTPERTVAEILIDLLARSGVEHVFGVAGSTIMPLLDGIESDDRIAYVGARYELSAAEMASGYARASARLGVVMTHVGPGATSCITALAAAARDGVPLLLITGNEESETLAREPYHDWDLLGVMRSLMRFTYRITRPDELPHVVRRALTEAARGVTGAVHIDLPEDIALTRVRGEDAASWLPHVDPVLQSFAAAPALPISRPAPSAAEVDRTIALLADAEAPMVLLGEATSWTGDRDRIVAGCEQLGIPYATTFGARGGIGDRDGYVGTVGRFGSRDTTALLGSADLVIALGAELTDVDTTRWRVPGPDARLVIIHPDPGKVDRRLPATLGVMADPVEFVGALMRAYAGSAVGFPDTWRQRAAQVDRAAGPLGDPASDDDPPLDALLVSRAIAAAPGSWVVSADPGFAPLTLSAPADFGRTRFLYSYGLGSMGFAVPSAIGATLANEVDGALAIVGDGSLFMSLSSLESIASLGAPVVVVVLDDGGFGSQRKKQQEGYGRNVGVDYDNPDIAAIAAAMGIESTWIDSPEDVTSLCDSFATRRTGSLAVVRRSQEQTGTWYEGSSRRR